MSDRRVGRWFRVCPEGVQVPRPQGLHAVARTIISAAAAAGGLLPVILFLGCSAPPASLSPADWWHALEGGKIAEQRPPPPNADAPYPNLGSVPQRPVITDAATRGQIASTLLADRANAQYAGPLMPEPPPPGGPAKASGSPAGTPPRPPPPSPPAESDTPSASLQAATAPPAAPGKLPAPGPAAPPPSDRPDAAADGPATQALPADAGGLTIPAAPPPAPHVQGADIPATTAPTPPPVAPSTPPPVPKPSTAATSVAVPFQPGAAVIAPESQDALRALALRRGAAPMEAIGYGDAAGAEPSGQSAALPLALARARAVAAVLTASGVPASLVTVQAEAEGRGGAARIADPGGAARNTN